MQSSFLTLFNENVVAASSFILEVNESCKTQHAGIGIKNQMS